MTNFPPNLPTKFINFLGEACIKSIKTFMISLSSNNNALQIQTGYAYGQFAGYQQAGYMGYVYNNSYNKLAISHFNKQWVLLLGWFSGFALCWNW